MPVIINTKATDLIRAYNLSNVRVINATSNPYDGKVPQNIQRDKELYLSSLGTPVMADVTFKGKTYINSYGKTITFDDVRFETVLLNVSQPKNIVKTEIQGRDGTIKEYVGQGDYEVTVNGIITGPNGHHPADEIRAFKKMLDASVPIEVISRYLQNLDIYNLVVESWDMQQAPGGYSYQAFTINCISDLPVELQIL